MSEDILWVCDEKHKDIFEKFKNEKSIKLKHYNDRPLFIITHGYGSSFFDLLNVASRLSNLEFNVEIVILNAHCDNYNLSEMSYRKWSERLTDIYKANQKVYSEIYLIGFSLGALLSLDLAENYDVNGVITVSGYLGLEYSTTVSYLSDLLLKFKIEKVFRVIQVSEKAKYDVPHLKYLPLENVKMLEENANVVKRKISKLKTKRLHFHSVDDLVASFNEIEKITKKYSEVARVVTLNHLPHFMQFDVDNKIMVDMIIKYFGIDDLITSKSFDELEIELIESLDKGLYIVNERALDMLRKL
ncbi:MAG: hypothetical protein WBA54_04165 [Acidaminobacteraceae bacterium]